MKNLFSALGFPLSLSLEETEIESSWRDRTREFSESTESSGFGSSEDDNALAELHEARSVLLDPGKRIAHWLELHEVETSRAAVMSADLMDLFGSLSGTLSQTDDFLSRHRDAHSAIGRALLTKEAVQTQLELQSKMQAIQAMKAEAASSFPNLDADGSRGDFSNALSTWQRLRFLSKWESQCQERLLSLLEC